MPGRAMAGRGRQWEPASSSWTTVHGGFTLSQRKSPQTAIVRATATGRVGPATVCGAVPTDQGGPILFGTHGAAVPVGAHPTASATSDTKIVDLIISH